MTDLPPTVTCDTTVDAPAAVVAVGTPIVFDTRVDAQVCLQLDVRREAALALDARVVDLL